MDEVIRVESLVKKFGDFTAINGIDFAVEAGLAQLTYLVLFSYAFFFKGFSGLAVTIGSIITLFIVMQLTARIRWSEHFAKKSPVQAHAG